MKPILSLRDLAIRVGVPLDRLREMAANVSSHYRYETKRTGPAKVRDLWIPDAELKDVQRRIKKRVLDPIALSTDVHGGVKGRSPRTNAVCHLAKPCVVTIDVRQFFDDVRHGVVFRMFRQELGFGTDVASLLTRLTTLHSYLPQGAATSTSVANLVLSMPVDGPLAVLAKPAGIAYTRFVDDIGLSGSQPRPLINVAARLLSHRGLKTHRKRSKLKIMPRSRPQLVTGLLVNSTTGPSVPRERRDAVRAAIFNLRKLDKRSLVELELRSILGKIAHVQQFNPGAASRLRRHLDKTVQAIVDKDYCLRTVRPSGSP